MRLAVWSAALAILLAGAPPSSAQEPEYALSPMRVQTLRAFDFFYASAQAKPADIAKTIQQLNGPVAAAMKTAQVPTGNPGAIIYRPAGGGQTTVEVGTMVAAGTKPAGAAKVRKVPALRCATVLFCGPYKDIPRAYTALTNGLKEAGLQATGEYREYYLYQAGPQSPNNVVLVQAGIAAGAEPADNPPFVVTEARVRVMPGFDFFYVSGQATASQIAATVTGLWQKVWAAAKEAKVWFVGPGMVCYVGAATGDQPMILEAGYPVWPAKEGGDAKLRKLTDFRCMALAYSGSAANLSRGAAAANQAVQAAGLKAAREYREQYLYWEDANSPNNVVLIEIGLQD